MCRNDRLLMVRNKTHDPCSSDYKNYLMSLIKYQINPVIFVFYSISLHCHPSGPFRVRNSGCVSVDTKTFCLDQPIKSFISIFVIF